ncbi:MAG: hypothetical protein BM557_00545 [Flavobacterium sp. MedPE-SWcel]|uniref:S1C family serine protease n=1 Tax=uncultured Flavobacterium sp. TaxID=165435 RepID=UPI0009126EA1|nr:trypsin-like peptidase domain-containing protein [uncultured Flavobacterium sp.]OIQ22509.1 MAG: hypothetical protein BM557_00545 [Flavobacterium sp. MedPE-SWcel]
MIKKLSCLLFLVFSSIYAQNKKLPELYKEVNNSVVYIDIISHDYSRVIENQKVSSELSLGSGVLVSKDGLIWTAEHVINASEEIRVEFRNGDSYKAEVVSSNSNADIALIKIVGEFDLEGKKVARIGDSDKVDVGEDIFVLGAPYGLKQSLTKGIVSGRYVPENLNHNFQKISFLQTDAAINPGNSGGPVFNMKGEVVGIASRILTRSGGFDGISFAVSSNTAKKILEEESTTWIGVESVLLPHEVARILNIPQDTGVLITKVSSKGTAAKIGLRGGFIPSVIGDMELLLGGDILLEIAGVKLVDQEAIYSLRDKMKAIKVGEKFSIVILRQGLVSEARITKE